MEILAACAPGQDDRDPVRMSEDFMPTNDDLDFDGDDLIRSDGDFKDAFQIQVDSLREQMLRRMEWPRGKDANTSRRRYDAVRRLLRSGLDTLGL